LDFIIAFRTDLFIKVYQRIQSADYPVLSILPSANPLNAWDGFSVIGGNGGGMLRAALGTAFLSTVTNLIEIANLSNSASCRLEYTACWQFVVFFTI